MTTATPDELISVLDQSFQPVKTVTKQTAHERGLLHATVIAELVDSQGYLTLVEQAPDRQDAGQYVSPVGGHVRAGESYEAALIREAIEEVGIKPQDYKFVGQAVYNREVIGRKENHLFVLYEIYTDKQPVLNHESVSYKSFSPEQLSKALKKSPNLFGNSFHFVVKTFYPQLLK